MKKHAYESDTVILRRHPLLKAAIDYCVKRLEAFAFTLVVSAALLAYQSCANKKQIWQETGPHLQDILLMARTNQMQIQELRSNE